MVMGDNTSMSLCQTLDSNTIPSLRGQFNRQVRVCYPIPLVD